MRTFKGISPYSMVHLQKSGKGGGVYEVFAKEGNKFPKCLGKPTTDAFCRERECLMLGFELSNVEGGIEFVLYTVNPDIAPTKTAESLHQGQERIIGFVLTPAGRGYGIYGNDAILIEASKDLHYLTLRFYADAGSHAPHFLELWTQGLLQCRVP